MERKLLPRVEVTMALSYGLLTFQAALSSHKGDQPQEESMLKVRLGDETIPVSKVRLDRVLRSVPYLICTDTEEGEGMEDESVRFLGGQQLVFLVLDDGRAFPALARIRGDVIECIPSELPRDEGYRPDEYIGGWALPW